MTTLVSTTYIGLVTLDRKSKKWIQKRRLLYIYIKRERMTDRHHTDRGTQRKTDRQKTREKFNSFKMM